MRTKLRVAFGVQDEGCACLLHASNSSMPAMGLEERTQPPKVWLN